MKTRTKTAVAAAGVAALALVGGVAAQFTASTDSANQRIESGVVSIAFENESEGWVAPSTNSWTAAVGKGVKNLAAGDSEIVTVDFVNLGTTRLDGDIELKAIDHVPNALTADLNGAELRDDSLRLEIRSPYGVLYEGPIHELFGEDAYVIPSDTVLLDPGARTPLNFKYTVPASAGNEYQGKVSDLLFTAEATQRSSTSSSN